MEPSDFESTFGDTLSAALVAARGPPPIENVPFKIPMGIIAGVSIKVSCGNYSHCR